MRFQRQIEIIIIFTELAPTPFKSIGRNVCGFVDVFVQWPCN